MMKILYDGKEQVSVIPVLEGKLASEFSKLAGSKLFTGKAGECYYCHNCNHIFLGLGTNGDDDDLRLAGATLAKNVKKLQISSISFHFGEDQNAEALLPLLVEGIYYGCYDFNKYKSEKDNFAFDLIVKENDPKISAKLAEITELMDGVKFAKDLVNTPSNDLYPESYVEILKNEFKDLAVTISVLNEAEMKKLHMDAALAVGQGSDRKPYFVEIKYQPNQKSDEFLTLVGKGLTYDSGGYAIKPATGMVDMKTDMGGSASVFAALKVIASNKLKQNVCAVSAIVENMINGSAYKNGDIISSMKGLSIFVGNTDAEGRVTMADSLYYAATKVNSKAIIELSTLTGACIVALGDDIAGCVATNDKLFDQIKKASLPAGENIHRFPTTKKLEDSIKHNVADITNIPNRGKAGSITAGLFLTHFVENKPYAHIDIAGPAYIDEYRHHTFGATGFGVKTLYYLAKNFKL